MPTIRLREIRSDNVCAVCRPPGRPEQEQRVASNAFSLAEALFAKEAWCRAICADEQPVGFVMLWDDTLNTVVQQKPALALASDGGSAVSEGGSKSEGQAADAYRVPTLPLRVRAVESGDVATS